MTAAHRRMLSVDVLRLTGAHPNASCGILAGLCFAKVALSGKVTVVWVQLNAVDIGRPQVLQIAMRRGASAIVPDVLRPRVG